jgi:hypothetical protein
MNGTRQARPRRHFMIDVLVRFMWPVWALIAYQVPLNLLMGLFFRQPFGENAFGDWLYGRACGQSMNCGGVLVEFWVLVTFVTVFTLNLVYQSYCWWREPPFVLPPPRSGQ